MTWHEVARSLTLGLVIALTAIGAFTFVAYALGYGLTR